MKAPGRPSSKVIGRDVFAASSGFPQAEKLKSQIKLLGTSVRERYEAVDTELKQFNLSLQKAIAVFEETDDLASYSAQKFSTTYFGGAP